MYPPANNPTHRIDATKHVVIFFCVVPHKRTYHARHVFLFFTRFIVFERVGRVRIRRIGLQDRNQTQTIVRVSCGFAHFDENRIRDGSVDRVRLVLFDPPLLQSFLRNARYEHVQNILGVA